MFGLQPITPTAFVTHAVLSPSDRTIIAACSQVGCLKYRYGWDSPIDERTEEGQFYAQLIRSGRHGRTFRELPRTADGLTVFRFEAHQRCFAEHRTRRELYVVRGGTPTVSTGLIREHTGRPDLFIEDYRETLDRRLHDRERG